MGITDILQLVGVAIGVAAGGWIVGFLLGIVIFKFLVKPILERWF